MLGVLGRGRKRFAEGEEEEGMGGECAGLEWMDLLT